MWTWIDSPGVAPQKTNGGGMISGFALHYVMTQKEQREKHTKTHEPEKNWSFSPKGTSLAAVAVVALLP